MVGESGTSKTGRLYHYYKCVSAKNKTGCKKKAVKKDWIENLVIEQIQKVILDDALLSYITDLIMDVQARENVNLPLLHQRLTEAEKGIENMLNAIQAGIFTTSTKERLEALEETKRDIDIKILQEELQKPTLSPKQIKFFLHKFRELDITKPEHRQRLIDSFVNTIFVFDDRLVLTFNYKDSEKTVSLSDLQGSDLNALPAPSKIPFNHAVLGDFSFGKMALIFVQNRLVLRIVLQIQNTISCGQPNDNASLTFSAMFSLDL